MSWVQYVLVGLLLATMVAMVLYRAKVQAGARSTLAFLGEVKAEVTKITWPTREELRKATIVILVFVVVVAVVIGAMDLILQWILVSLPSRIS